MFQDAAKSFCAVSIQVAVGHVEHLDLCVRLEDRHQDHEVFAADIVLTDVKISNSVSVLECQREMLKSETIIEELVESSLLEFILVAELDL